MIHLFDAHFEPPSFSDLNKYNLVLTWSNIPYADADETGDVMADYQDSGQGFVIPLAFSFAGPGRPDGLNGRWFSGNYSPFTYSTDLRFGAQTLGTFDAGHPLMQGVTSLNTDYLIGVGLAAGATQVAAWSELSSSDRIQGRCRRDQCVSRPGSAVDRPVRAGDRQRLQLAL